MKEVFDKLQLWHKMSLKDEADYDEQHNMLRNEWMMRTAFDKIQQTAPTNIAKLGDFIDADSIWQEAPDRMQFKHYL